MMNKKIVINIPQIEDILLFYFFTLPIWRDFVFSHLPGGSYFGSFLGLVALVAVTLVKQYRSLNRLIDVFLLYLVIILLFVFKFWGNPDMSEWIDRLYGLKSVITWGAPLGYIVIRLQYDFNRMMNVLKHTGLVLAIYYAWKSLEVITTGYWTIVQFDVERHSTSNMSWSYGVLMAICFLSIYLLKDKKKIVLLPMILGVIGILIYGSRGTIICLVIGIVLLVLFFHEGKMTWKNYLLIFAIAAALIFLLSDNGLLMISTLLQNKGVSSRFIDSMVGFKFSNFEETSNGRWIIWITVLDLIKNGPFYGYGVYGERNAVYSLGMKWGYSHNIFLEILVSFGWLFGSIIIIFAVVQIVRFFRSSKNADEKLVFILFLTIGFELLLSNSLWLQCAPWVLMALVTNHFQNSYSDLE